MKTLERTSNRFSLNSGNAGKNGEKGTRGNERTGGGCGSYSKDVPLSDLPTRLLEPLRDDNFNVSQFPGHKDWGPETERSAGAIKFS